MKKFKQIDSQFHVLNRWRSIGNYVDWVEIYLDQIRHMDQSSERQIKGILEPILNQGIMDNLYREINK